MASVLTSTPRMLSLRCEVLLLRACVLDTVVWALTHLQWSWSTLKPIWYSAASWIEEAIVCCLRGQGLQLCVSWACEALPSIPSCLLNLFSGSVSLTSGCSVGLCGTKLGCGEGGCGACTVMISKYDCLQNKIVYPLPGAPWEGRMCNHLVSECVRMCVSEKTPIMNKEYRIMSYRVSFLTDEWGPSSGLLIKRPFY